MLCTNDAFSDFDVACTVINLLIYICLSTKKPYMLLYSTVNKYSTSMSYVNAHIQ